MYLKLEKISMVQTLLNKQFLISKCPEGEFNVVFKALKYYIGLIIPKEYGPIHIPYIKEEKKNGCSELGF